MNIHKMNREQDTPYCPNLSPHNPTWSSGLLGTIDSTQKLTRSFNSPQ